MATAAKVGEPVMPFRTKWKTFRLKGFAALMAPKAMMSRSTSPEEI